MSVCSGVNVFFFLSEVEMRISELIVFFKLYSSSSSIDQLGDKNDGEAALAMGMRLDIPNPPVIVLAIFKICLKIRKIR